MWLKKARNHEILGTYAQTEIGHGSLMIPYSYGKLA